MDTTSIKAKTVEKFNTIKAEVKDPTKHRKLKNVGFMGLGAGLLMLTAAILGGRDNEPNNEDSSCENE